MACEQFVVEQDFSGQDLTGADFFGKLIIRCNFSGANLRGACFTAAYIEDTTFSGADLNDARFIDCEILNADFNGAKSLTAAVFRAALMDSKTGYCLELQKMAEMMKGAGGW